ncbi:MAG: hypothetical protein AAFN09_17655, partial [Pseudomonadota bacterium]
ATAGILSLFAGLAIAFLLWSYLAAGYAIELLSKEGRVDSGLGADFLKAVDPRGNGLSESGYLRLRTVHPSMLILLVSGCMSLGVLVLRLLWSGP